MAFIDYYKILGVDRNIPQKDVRAAYRKRAKQFHPDLHPNDPKAKAKFQALSEAFEVIGDPEKRAKYTSMANNGVMLKPTRTLVDSVVLKVHKVEETHLVDSISVALEMEVAALVASSKTSSEAEDVVAHLVSTLVEHKANVLQDKWRLLLVSTFTPLYWVVR